MQLLEPRPARVRLVHLHLQDLVDDRFSFGRQLRLVVVQLAQVALAAELGALLLVGVLGDGELLVGVDVSAGVEEDQVADEEDLRVGHARVLEVGQFDPQASIRRRRLGIVRIRIVIVVVVAGVTGRSGVERVVDENGLDALYVHDRFVDLNRLLLLLLKALTGVQLVDLSRQASIVLHCRGQAAQVADVTRLAHLVLVQIVRANRCWQFFFVADGDRLGGDDERAALDRPCGEDASAAFGLPVCKKKYEQVALTFG